MLSRLSTATRARFGARAMSAMQQEMLNMKEVHEWKLVEGKVPTKNMSNFAKELDYCVMLPKDFQKDEKLPLVCVLHGGAMDAKRTMEGMKTMLEEDTHKRMMEGKMEVPKMNRCVMASFSTIKGMGLYMDYLDESMMYKKFFTNEWLPFLGKEFNFQGEKFEKPWLKGISMGGLGALGIALEKPFEFSGVMAMEPVIDPALLPMDIKGRNILNRVLTDEDRHDKQVIEMEKMLPRKSMDAEMKAMYGGVHPSSWDVKHYMKHNPVNILMKNRSDIVKSQMDICIEVGDRDFMNLHDGAEFMHRMMWRMRVPHEYKLVLGADHAGKSMDDRLVDSLHWMKRSMKMKGGALNTKMVEPISQKQEKYLNWMFDKYILKKEGMGENAPQDSEKVDLFRTDQGLHFMKMKMKGSVMRNMDKPFDGFDRMSEFELMNADKLAI